MQIFLFRKTIKFPVWRENLALKRVGKVDVSRTWFISSWQNKFSARLKGQRLILPPKEERIMYKRPFSITEYRDSLTELPLRFRKGFSMRDTIDMVMKVHEVIKQIWRKSTGNGLLIESYLSKEPFEMIRMRDLRSMPSPSRIPQRSVLGSFFVESDVQWSLSFPCRRRLGQSILLGWLVKMLKCTVMTPSAPQKRGWRLSNLTYLLGNELQKILYMLFMQRYRR